MYSAHAHHSLRLHRTLRSSLGLFEQSVWMQTFARALISIFVPIFLLQAGYDVTAVLVYFLLFNAFDVPLDFFARWLIRRIGARAVMIIGSGCMLVYFLLLSFLTVGDWPLLVLIAFFAAAYDALYWVAQLFFFMESSTHKRNIGHDASSLFIVQQLAEVMAPAIGAGLIILLGEDVLLYVSVILVALSTIPLFRIKDVRDKPRKASKPWTVFWTDWSVARDYVSTGFYGMHIGAELELFPIFLFLLIGNVQSVAAVAVLAAFATMLFTYFTGRLKRSHRAQIIIAGSVIIAVLWVARVLINEYIFLYASVFVVGLSSVMISIPLVSTLFEKGEKIDTLSASMWRNVCSMGSKVLMYGALLIAVEIFHVGFITAAAGMMGILIIHALIQRRLTPVTKPI